MLGGKMPPPIKNHYYKSSYHLHLNEQNQTINMSTWFSALLHVPIEKHCS